MKNSTITNLQSILAILKTGPATIIEVVIKTGLSSHQVNACSGVWSNGGQAATPVLWERSQVGGHTFLTATEEGKTWAPAKAEAKAKVAKAPIMDVEAARQALLAKLEESKETVQA